MVATTEKETETKPEEPEATSEDAEVKTSDDAGTTEPVETTSTRDDASVDDGNVSDNDPPAEVQRKRFWRRERPWGQLLRRSALPLLLVAALAVSGLLGWKQWQQHQITQAGQQARQAAIAYAEVLTSIDSNNVDQNFRQVLDGATGEFKDMYTQSSVQLRQLLIDNKATAHGVIVDSAIQSESTNRVVVLLFIDQTVTNTQLPDPRIDRSRIKVTMDKVDGRWLAAKVQLL